MKKNVFVLALFCIVSMMANAEVAKYCMSYDDFVAGNWKSVDELTAGRTQQVCQMKSGDHGVFYFKTAITRINDDFMDQLLANDTPLLERYKAVKAKYNRQSAANILPILMEKGLVESAAN